MIGRFEIVIFDCDGVLVDTEPIAIPVLVEALAELGWRMGEAEAVRRFMGRTDRHMTREVEAHLGRPIPAGWRAAFERRREEAFERGLRPVDGVVEALDEIGPAVCVASNGGEAKIRHSLQLAGLLERFVGRIFSASAVAHGKPAPDLFLHAAATLGVLPESCAVVEDSPSGVTAARRARMACFAYAGGLAPRDQLTGRDTVVFDDMRRLPDLLRAVAPRT